LEKSRKILILVGLLFVLIAINYSYIDNFLEDAFSEDGNFLVVERVIDGDTVKINGTSVRLLGINCPEKGEEFSSEATEFLEGWVLGKGVQLKYGKDKIDRYGRTLAYIFYGDTNVNLEIVRNGFANYYFPSGKDAYLDNFVGAWEKCVGEGRNICEKSSDVCADCVGVKSFDMKKEDIEFFNSCGFDCSLAGWSVKDEGRKVFDFSSARILAGQSLHLIVTKGEEADTADKIFWKRSDYVWTGTGDTLILRDSDGNLVVWEKKGY